jgi:hypothetical protein
MDDYFEKSGGNAERTAAQTSVANEGQTEAQAAGDIDMIE